MRRRRVFFIGGFDPQGPAHYHRLYAEQAALQGAVSGYRIEVGARVNDGVAASSWSVQWRKGLESRVDEGVETTFEFLRWDDIVRDHWDRGRWRVMLATLASTAHQIRNGVLWRILKTSWPAFIVLAMPPLLVAGLAVWLLATLAMAYASWREWIDAASSNGSALGAMVTIALAVSLSVWAGFRFVGWAEARVQMAWLMRSTRFILAQARQGVPALESRLDAFARRVADARADPQWDEILVVGHSSGAMLAVSAVARALSARMPASTTASPNVTSATAGDEFGANNRGSSLVPTAPAADRPNSLSLLTLGECIPMLSYQPEARGFRGELATIARSRAVAWIDFTAPPDGCCFALVDPTAVCEERSSSVEWQAPKRLSPRFAQLFSSAVYERIRRDKYRCHFQYLMASDLPGNYDFFAMTAGPLRLAPRYQDQRSVDGFRDFQRFGGDR